MRPPTRAFTLPFALLGLAGGALAHAIFQFWPLLVATPICSALLGALLSRHARNGLYATAGGTLLAGIVNGLLCLLLVSIGDARPNDLTYLGVAVWFGFLCALPFVPALVYVAWVARRSDRARPRSLFAAAEGRAVWQAAATAAAGMSWLATLFIRPQLLSATRPAGMTLAATVVVLLLLAADGRALAQLDRLTRRAVRPSAPDRLSCGPVTDLGLGDEQREEIAPARGPYREADRVTAILRGHPGQARAALLGRLRAGACSLALCGLALTAQLILIARLQRF